MVGRLASEKKKKLACVAGCFCLPPTRYNPARTKQLGKKKKKSGSFFFFFFSLGFPTMQEEEEKPVLAPMA